MSLTSATMGVPGGTEGVPGFAFTPTNNAKSGRTAGVTPRNSAHRTVWKCQIPWDIQSSNTPLKFTCQYDEAASLRVRSL